MSYTPARLTDNELLECFPEGAKIIPSKIRELSLEREEIMKSIELFRARVVEIAKAEGKDDFFVWFWKDAYIKHFHAPRIVELDKQIIELKRLRRIYSHEPKNQKMEEWAESKRRAKQAPIELITARYLNNPRKSGNRITARCPFHEDSSPSFTIYVESNKFHCYGCGAHGDSIDFLMQAEKIDFSEAVRRLQT